MASRRKSYYDSNPHRKLLKFLFFLVVSTSNNYTSCQAALAETNLSKKNNAFRNPNKENIQTIPPTDKDIAMEQWYRRQHILGTSQIKLRTTPLSIGGRGLFFLPEKHLAAQQGDILARIPARSILTEETAGACFPDLRLALQEKNGDWPSTLTAYARKASNLQSDSKSNNCVANDDGVIFDANEWSEWIRSWEGGGPKHAPRALSSYSENDIQFLAESCSSTAQNAMEMIEVRYKAFLRDLDRMMLGEEESIQSDEDMKRRRDECAELYSIVVSRVANLGPEWGCRRGIIPFHDMINHCPSDTTHNIELFTVGDIRKMTSDEYFLQLWKSSGLNCENGNIKFLVDNDGSDDKKVLDSVQPPLQDRDVLLVANRKLLPGEELFLLYKGSKTEFEERERLWLYLQYGFPFA